MSTLDTLLSTNPLSPTSTSNSTSTTLTCLGTRTRTNERCGIPFDNPLLPSSAANRKPVKLWGKENEHEKESRGAVAKTWQMLHEAVQSRRKITVNNTDLVALAGVFLCPRHRGVWTQVWAFVLRLEGDIARYEEERPGGLPVSGAEEEEEDVGERANRNKESMSGQKFTGLDSTDQESPQERVQSWLLAVRGAEARNKMLHEPGPSALHLGGIVQSGTAYDTTSHTGSRGRVEAQQSALPRGPHTPQSGLYGLPSTIPQRLQLLYLPAHRQLLGPWSLPPPSSHIPVPGSYQPEEPSTSATFYSETKKRRHAQRKPLTTGDECPICLEELLVPAQRKPPKMLTWCRRQCGTNFHSACIMKWRKRHDSVMTEPEAIIVQTQTCPACRVESTWNDWFGARGYSRD